MTIIKSFFGTCKTVDLRPQKPLTMRQMMVFNVTKDK